MMARRRFSTRFSILNSGMPYRSRPPMRSDRSKTVTRWPARFSCSAAASPAGPDPTTATFLSGADQRRLRRHPAFRESAVDDGHLDRLDRHGIVVDPEHARTFARCRTQPARELGKIVGRVQPLERGFPAIAVDQIVPVGNQIAERATLMAKRDAAVHAPRTLLAERLFRVRKIHFVPILDALRDGARWRLLAMHLDEASWLAHR